VSVDEKPTYWPIFDWLKAIRDSNLSASEKNVAFVLSTYLNKSTGYGYPSQETIAAGASLGLRTVNRAINTLEQHQFISKKIHKTGAKRHQKKEIRTWNCGYEFSFPSEPRSATDAHRVSLRSATDAQSKDLLYANESLRYANECIYDTPQGRTNDLTNNDLKNTGVREFAKTMFTKLQATITGLGGEDADGWANQIDELLVLHDISLAELAGAFEWANANEFWRPVIRDPVSLGKHLPKVIDQMKSRKHGLSSAQEGSDTKSLPPRDTTNLTEKPEAEIAGLEKTMSMLPQDSHMRPQLQAQVDRLRMKLPPHQVASVQKLSRVLG